MTYYRIVKTQMVDGDQYAMDGAMYMGRLVPVEPDYEDLFEAVSHAIHPTEVFTASDGKPGIRFVERTQRELIELSIDAVLTTLGIGETP